MAGIGLILDPLRTNLALFGAAEAAVGWERGSGTGTVEADAFSEAWKFAGSKSRYLKFKSGAPEQAANIHCGRSTSLDIPVEEALVYTFSLRYNLVQKGAKNVLAFVQWFDASNALLVTSILANVGATGEGRINATAPSPTSATHCVVVFGSNASSSFGLNTGETLEVYVDQVVVELGECVGKVDFPTSAQLASGYAGWTGTPFESPSQLGEVVPVPLAAKQLDLNDGSKCRAMGAKFPTPPRDISWAESSDTEGGLPANLRYQNRVITITCRVVGSSAADLNTQLGYLEQKVGKINEEGGVGGTLEYVSPSGAVCVFDLLEGSADYDLDNTALANKWTEVTITFTARPFWRSGKANETAGTDHVETAKPAVIGVDQIPLGDVPAAARLVVDDDQGVDQWSLIWGLQSCNYSASADAELLYEAETRTLMGGSELKVLSGASGGGSNAVFNGILFPTLQPILSTQKTGGGNHFAHVGTFRIFARLFRPSSNAGKVTVALQWAQGDFQQSTLNDSKTWEANELEGVFTFTDLGLVTIEKAPAGTQRWEGRVLASSTQPGDDIYIDGLFLFPADEGYGELKVEPTPSGLTTVAAHDEFEQTAGNLDTPKAMPVGGSWSEANKVGAEGFKVNSTFKVAERAVVSDVAGSGSYAIAGATTSPFASVSVLLTATTMGFVESQQGLLLRYTNVNNWFKAVLVGMSSSKQIAVEVFKKVGGSQTFIRSAIVATGVTSFSEIPLRLTAFPSGRWRVEGNGVTLEGYDADLAIGGALATGQAGMYDEWAKAAACTRQFDNFSLLTGVADAAIYASRSLEVRSDSMLRQDSTGTVVSPRADYRGTYVHPPPARRENRSVRTIVKLSRGEVDSLPDTAIDDASFRLFWQARGLVLPES